MPKKSGLMNERERAVCARVKSLREGLQYSQPAFALALGLTVDQLASIEYGRVPLRCAIGQWICQRFDVNQRWLAEGKAPKFYYVYYSGSRAPLAPNILFSQAYDDNLKFAVEKLLKEVAKRLGCEVEHITVKDAHLVRPEGIAHVNLDTYNFIIGQTVAHETASIPPYLYQEFYSALFGAARSFRSKYRRPLAKFAAEKGQSQKKPGPPG